MYVLELAGQNVKGLSPTVRAQLKPGYLVLKPPGGAAVPLAGLIGALCYPDGRGGDAAFAAPGAAGQKAKVGLTLLGNDQTTYRLLRELGGSGSLSRLNKATQSWEVVTEETSDLAQFLRGQVGFPSKGTYEQLFLFTAAHLPSRRPKPQARPALGAAGAKATSPSLASAHAVSAAGDVGAAQTKLQELEQELAVAKEVEEIQFRADGIASQLFELEQKLQGGEGLKAALAQAQAEHEGAPSPERYNLPADIVQRAEQYPQLEQRRDEQLAKLEAEGLPADSGPVQAAYVPPLTQDQRFLGALGAGVALLALALFLSGFAKYVALLGIPAFTFAALLALRYVDDLEDSQKSTRKGGMRAAREKKIRDDFEAQSKVVKDALKALDLSSPSELIEVLSRKALLLEKVEDFRQQLRAYQKDPEYLGALAAQKKLKDQQDALNAQLTEKGQYMRDPRQIELELSKTRESIQLARQGPAATPAAAASAAAAPTGEKLDDPCPALLAAAADLLQADIPSVAAAAKDRIAQYLAALSDRRMTAIEFDSAGKATVVNAQGARAAVSSLPARDVDVLYTSVRLTMIERVSARLKLPVVIEQSGSGDGAVLAVDEPKFGLLARMLKHLGTLTQVLHVTTAPAFAQAADVQVAL